ncbi:hypothetical protein ACQKLX_07270 [Bosea sp. NPDC003192]|uniref:hypothetical protein n=1 Tax=Bosea sp. NPDC003192 TaxID=3390551 RepID=UPI003CFF876C
MKKLSEQLRRHCRQKAILGSSSRIRGAPVIVTALSPRDVWIKDCESRGYERVAVYRNGQTEIGFVSERVDFAPENLSFIGNYEETVGFLAEVDSAARQYRTRTRRQRRARDSNGYGTIVPKYWDYSTIKNITLPVAMVIASQYDRLSRLNKWRPAAIDIHNWAPGVLGMLKSIGFLELCNVDQQSQGVARLDSLLIRKMRAGGSAAGEEIGAFLDDLGLAAVEQDPQIYGALFEAILNSHNHAYDHVEGADGIHLWWLAGALDEITNELIVCVYDHGVSIPVSLSRPYSKWPLLHTLQELWHRAVGHRLEESDGSQDGLTISLAMQLGKSRTNESNRGKGLPAIENVIDICESGYVAIRSRRGEYTRRKGEEPITTTRVAALRGTLVVWRLKLPGRQS